MMICYYEKREVKRRKRGDADLKRETTNEEKTAVDKTDKTDDSLWSVLLHIVGHEHETMAPCSQAPRLPERPFFAGVGLG